ncbi:methyltransferase domain-containing protein [uncultured Gimesia sp.]|uniref:methyltransferase domain-containing protein n=1 Tax=uncultured Gimesia sp. TaxID=1678688 RepID=UPI0030DBAD73
MMGDSKHYVIRGGIEGRERLRILARVMHESTGTLLNRLELSDGQLCLDVGCGGGDVTRELANHVAPAGKAVGTDIDATKLEIAREESEEARIENIEFRLSNICEALGAPEFDVVYSRFLLTHLSDPAGAVKSFLRQLRPGGILALEDIDFSGSFTYPDSGAFRKFYDLFCTVVRNRGGDPNMGQRLPLIMKECGLQAIQVSLVQPTGLVGDVKRLNALTMENIADTVLADQLATNEEIDQIVRELYEYAADERTLAGVPRVVQVWGRLPFA